MEDEVVRRPVWVTRERFLDLLSAANLVPGPNATELAIHLGYVRAGFSGLLVAGAAFVTPAALTTTAVAVVYVGLGSLPELAAVLAALKPAPRDRGCRAPRRRGGGPGHAGAALHDRDVHRVRARGAARRPGGDHRDLPALVHLRRGVGPPRGAHPFLTAAGAFLDGVNVASLALMAVVTTLLGRDAFTSIPSFAIAAVAALLLRLGVNSGWVVLGSAGVGWITWALTEAAVPAPS